MMKIPAKRHDAITDAIKELYRRSIVFQTNELTHDDLIQLHIRPEHRAMVVDVIEVLGMTGGGGYRTQAIDPQTRSKVDVYTVVNTDDKHPAFVLPQYIGGESQDAPEAKKKLEKFVGKRVRVAREFGLVQAVYEHLYLHCESLAEARFFWDPIVALLNMDEDPKSRDLADKLRRPKMPATMLSVGPELRRAFDQSAATVARALLLPKSDAELPWQPVVLNVTGYKVGDVPWLEGKPLPKF